MPHYVYCSPTLIDAYLEIASFVRSFKDWEKADTGYGAGSFQFKNREDARTAQDIINRYRLK